MTRAGFVCAGKDRINYTQSRRRANPPFRHAITTPQVTIISRGGFERADHSRSNRDHTTASLPRELDRFRCRYRNVIRLIERQQSIEIFIASR